MKDIEHAAINGVEIHNLAELDNEETLLYTGELWMDGKKIGSFTENENEEIELNVEPEFEKELDSRVARYITAMTIDSEDEEPISDDMAGEVFFEDLIELEIYLGAFKEALSDGDTCILVNYSDTGVDVFSLADPEDIEDVVHDNGLTDFQTFYEPEHFIINC